MKITVSGQIVNGKLSIFQKAIFSATIQNWKDCAIELTIKSKTKGRSNPQNRYYWGCVIPAVQSELKEQHGLVYMADDLHEFLKTKFNGVDIVSHDGVVERFPLTTTQLNTTEFEAYTEDIRRWAEDFLNVRIPLPNEQTELDLT